MKKLLLLLPLLLFSSCSAGKDSAEKWINSVYDQGWYWSYDGLPSDEPVPFQPDGSFIGSFTPCSDRPDLPKQDNTMYVLDEVVGNNTHAYYRFNYQFNGENLTLYYGIFHGFLDTTREPGIFWSYVKNDYLPSESALDSEKKAGLLKTFAKDNFDNSRGSALGLKKRGRSTISESNTPNDSNSPTLDNTSLGTIKE